MRLLNLSILLLALGWVVGGCARVPRNWLQISYTGAAATAQVTVDWTNIVRVSRSTPTLQVVVNPPLRRGSTIHDPVFKELHDLGAQEVRYVPWLPYPKLAVAELQPPTATNTSWDFSLIDPMTLDFLNATKGHSPILNFSTMPAWLFQTPQSVTYPSDPNEVFWNYTQGTELNDPTLKQLGDYYARLVSWYHLGGFTDELGVRHHSGYHYDIPWWEILNEEDSEHQTTPQQYVERYDAIVKAIHQVSSKTRFVGLALAYADKLDYYEYFLDPRHHQPGVPLDMISYHFYAEPGDGTNAVNPDAWHFCEQADHFLDTVCKVEAIRQRLSPATITDIDELGVIANDDNTWKEQPIYWNAAGAMYAYLYLELVKFGIEYVGESQLVGYPTQYPSVSMVNWQTGKPNARFRVLELLTHYFKLGDKLVATGVTSTNVAAQVYETRSGWKLLLVNKENVTVPVDLPANTHGTRMEIVDGTTGENPPQRCLVSGQQVVLNPFAVAVVSLEQGGSK
jgi:Glycosyl hydrolases family 39